MNSHRFLLVLAGALAVAGIVFAMVLRPQAAGAVPVPMPVLAAMMLGTYALGLGIGRLALNRRG